MVLFYVTSECVWGLFGGRYIGILGVIFSRLLFDGSKVMSNENLSWRFFRRHRVWHDFRVLNTFITWLFSIFRLKLWTLLNRVVLIKHVPGFFKPCVTLLTTYSLFRLMDHRQISNKLLFFVSRRYALSRLLFWSIEVVIYLLAILENLVIRTQLFNLFERD